MAARYGILANLDEATPIAEAGLLAQDVLRQVRRDGDSAVAFETLLMLVDRHGINSAPVAAFVQGLTKS